MRLLTTGAIVLTALAVRAEDDKNTKEAKQPKPKREKITRGEWEHLVTTIRNSGQTTVKQLAALREASAKHAIVDQGKISDIRPAESHGSGAVEIVLVGVEDGSEIPGFIVPGSQADRVSGWSKWDRVAWVSIAEVRRPDDIVLRAIYRSVADLRRTPNPGITLPHFKKARISFEQWRSRFKGLVRHRRYGDAWNHLQQYRDSAFPFAATVTESARGSIWARFTDGTVKEVPIPDPQLRETILVGARVVIAVRVETNAQTWQEFQRRGAPWHLVLRFWRLKREPTK